MLNYKWSSSNQEIAIVYGRKVKAVSAETAAITAAIRDKTATCTITVK